MNRLLGLFRDQPEPLLSRKLADCFRFAIPAGILIALAYIFYLNSYCGSCSPPGGRNIGVSQWFCVTLNCLILAANPAFFCVLKVALFLQYPQGQNLSMPIRANLYETILPLVAYAIYLLASRTLQQVRYIKFFRELIAYSLLFLLLSPFAHQITSIPATMVGWANVIILGYKFEHTKLFTCKADLGLQLVRAYCAIGQYQNATRLLTNLTKEEISRDPVFGDSLLGAFYTVKQIDKDHTLSKEQWIALCQPIEVQLLALYRSYKGKKQFAALAKSDYGVTSLSSGLIEGYKNHGAKEKVLEWNLRNIREQQLEHRDKSESYTYKLMDLARAYQACGMKAEARSTLEIAIARFESRQAERPPLKTETDKDRLGSTLHFEHNHIEECQTLLTSIANNELAQRKVDEESRHTLTYWKEAGQHIEMPYQDFDVAHRQGLCDLDKVAKLQNSKDTENCLRKLAELCYCHCRFIEAENYYQQLLELQTGHLQRGTTPELAEQTVLADLTELAGACRNQGELSKAAAKFEQVLRMKKKLEGSNYPNMARDLNNLAGLYFLQGDLKRAKPLNEQALALDQSRLGANHPAIAIYLKHLGQIHLELKEQQEAQKCFARAQAIERKVPE